MRTIKLGIGLFLSTLFFFTTSQAEDSVSSVLRKREHVLSWELSSGSSTMKLEGLDKIKNRSTEMNLAYQRNFGWWALGGGFASDVSKDSDNDETSMTTLAIRVQGNFIENRPGHDLIPYAALELGSLVGETETGSNTVDIRGSGWAFGVGFEWYPFGELFAVNVELSKTNADVKYDMPSSTNRVDADLETTSLSVGYRLAF